MSNIREQERRLFSFGTSSNQAVAPKVVVPVPPKGAPDTQAISDIDQLKGRAEVVDLFRAGMLELLVTQNPGLKVRESAHAEFERFYVNYLNGFDERFRDYVGSWIHYPDGVLLRTLYPRDYYAVLTSRNCGLVSAEEQERISNARIAIAGLSVGAQSSLVLAMEGFTHFRLVDPDVLSLSNLNRLASATPLVGRPKTELAARRIWDVNPFASVVATCEAYSEKLEQEVFSDWRPDVFLDAMDSPAGKTAARNACRKYRVPLVWLADIGDGVVKIGVERYDLDPRVVAYGGRVEHAKAQLGRELTFAEAITAIVGTESVDEMMMSAFAAACNAELPGIPQLAGTVSMAAGIASRTVRRVLSGAKTADEFVVRF